MPPLTPPQDCTTMRELRVQIDRIDRDLIGMLVARTRYIDRATELKPTEAMPARIPARVEEVVHNVRATAAVSGMDPDLAERLWRILIDWSIAREEQVIGAD